MIAMKHPNHGDVAVVPESAFEAHWKHNGWTKVAAKEADAALAAAAARAYDPEAEYDADAVAKAAATDKPKG